MRQPADDVFGDPVAEVSFLGVAAEVAERQDGDGRPPGPGKVGLRANWDCRPSGRRLDPVDPDRSADVLQLAFTEVAKRDWHLVPDVVADGAGDDDFPR